MSVYNVYEARDALSRIIAEAQEGTEVVIAKRGRPVVRVVPVEDGARPTTGAGLAEWFRDHPLSERLSTTPDEVDRRIRENREAWE